MKFIRERLASVARIDAGGETYWEVTVNREAKRYDDESEARAAVEAARAAAARELA